MSARRKKPAHDPHANMSFNLPGLYKGKFQFTDYLLEFQFTAIKSIYSTSFSCPCCHSVGKLKSCDSVYKLKFFCHSVNWNPMVENWYLPFRAFCVEGRQNLMFVRPSVCPSVRLVCVTLLDRTCFWRVKWRNFRVFEQNPWKSGHCHGSIPDLSQFDIITWILRNLMQTIYTEGSKGPPRTAGVI